METTKRPQATPELDALNAVFHDAHAAARPDEREAGPVFVLIDDALVIARGDRRVVQPVLDAAFHAIKTIAHLGVAVVIAAPGYLPAGGDPRRRVELAAKLDEARSRTASLPVGRAVVADLDLTLDMARSLLETAPRERVRALGNVLLRLTDHASGIELENLHAAAERAFAELTPSERRRVQVVVAGAHQARERSLGMSYFERRLGEAPGSDERVTYGENVTSVDEALELVAARRLDRALAQALFGDPKRLQRDILGDAAKARLDAASLHPISE